MPDPLTPAPEGAIETALDKLAEFVEPTPLRARAVLKPMIVAARAALAAKDARIAELERREADRRAEMNRADDEYQAAYPITNIEAILDAGDTVYGERSLAARKELVALLNFAWDARRALQATRERLAEAERLLRACVRAMTVAAEDGSESWNYAVKDARAFLAPRPAQQAQPKPES